MIPKCSSCNARGGIFRVLDGIICFICLDFLKHKVHYTHEDLYQLDCESIKKIIQVTKATQKVIDEK